ncbi:MAG TPA: hypothetical protein VNX68_01575 [Nitrosopumilaceae archaeon]|nr:hypothetical protein [Nitrosopumilaceae archaeon]
MLHDLKEKDLSTLYDLLAAYTSQYTHIRRWGGPSENIKEYEELILKVQSEIDCRKIETVTEEQPDNDLDDGLELAPVLA